MPTDFAFILHEQMLKSGLTIATAESCTVGLIMSYLGSNSGSSAYFKGGICAYDQDAKVMLLGVDAEHAAEVNCVSERVAMEMATGVADRFGADIGIATTGYVEPCPDEGIAFPKVWIGLWSKKTGPIAAHVFPNTYTYGPGGDLWWDREEVQNDFAERAILMVLAKVFDTFL